MTWLIKQDYGLSSVHNRECHIHNHYICGIPCCVHWTFLISYGGPFFSGFFYIYEPYCEKTGLRGFRPGATQTGLHNH